MKKIIGLILGITIMGGVSAKEIGFDPGMNKALAASLHPDNLARYSETCPDSSSGKCYGTILAGGGFYTLPYDADPLRPDMNGVYSDKETFEWKRDSENNLIAQVTLDIRSYHSSSTPSVYAGLQLNIPIGNSYAGLDFSNPLWAVPSNTIDRAKLEFRAVVCPRENDPYFLTLHYYSDGWSVEKQNGYSLAFNYAFSWNTPETPDIFKEGVMSQGQFMREWGIGTEADARLYDTTIAIDSHRYGMLPMPSNNSAITVSCTANIESLPFKKVTFNIGQWLNILEFKEIIHPLDSYKYSGGIIAGVELWGRAKVVIQVKDHTMLSGPLEDDNIDEGKFRLPDNSMWYSNGNGVCQYINLVHAGVASANHLSVVAKIPESMVTGWCPGAETLPLF